MNPAFFHTQVARTIALLLAVGLALSCSTAWAQSTVNDTSPEVDLVESDGANEGEEAGDEGAPDDSDGPKEEPGTPAEVLASQYGVVEDIEGDPEALEQVREEATRQRDEFKAAAEASRNAAEAAMPIVATLQKQVENEGLGAAARAIILGDLVRLRTERARAVASSVTNERLALREATKLELLARIDESKVDASGADTEAVDRQVEAEQEEQAALATLERAKAREAAELDATLKKLAAREREIAEKALEVTREYNQRIESVSNAINESNDAFGSRKAAILEKLDELPSDDPPPKQSKLYADPALDDAVEQRRDLRPRLYTAMDERERAEQRFDQAREARDAAESALAEEENRLAASDNSRLFKRRVVVARAEFGLAEKELANAEELLEVHDSHVEELEEQLVFYNDTIDDLLPLVTDDARDDFFRIADNDNLQDARDGVRDGIRHIYEGALERAEQTLHHLNNLKNPELWSSVFAILFRFLVAALGLYFLPKWLPWVFSRLTDLLMARRFFRRRPAFVVKLAEVLRGLSRPVLAYLAIQYVLGAVLPVLPELVVVEWLVDAIYAYVIVIEVARIFFLPRWHRRQQLEPSAESFETIDETEAKAVADVFNLELTRGRKFVRSARVITAFWLLATYIPEFVPIVIGTSIFSNLVDLLATWGFVFILYWVLSTWRDDIATLFDKVAKERLPSWIVDFVQRRKEGVLGVLVIGLASVYVIVVELALFLRRYLIDTEIFKRASNFAFRKKIEYQARERDNGSEEDPAEVALPTEFEDLFRDGVALEEAYEILPTDKIEHALGAYRVWKERRSQGSIAYVGETGIGKSTLLLRISQEFANSTDVEIPVVTKTVSRKQNRRRDVLDLLAEIFDLQPTFETRDQLIRVLKEEEPRVVVLDDCHNIVFRKIGGFEGLETLLDIINLTDETHFYIISFNSFAWSYVNRVRPREAYFGSVVQLGSWTEKQIQELIERRVEQTDYSVSFNDLVVTPDSSEKVDYLTEVVKTAAGYFRYLTEFSRGNPRVAMSYWLRSLTPKVGSSDEVSVGLFTRPSDSVFAGMSDSHWFVLTAIAQHGSLSAREVADVVNLEAGFCMLAVNFFEEREIVEREPHSDRVRLRPVYFRQVLRSLAKSNFLYS